MPLLLVFVAIFTLMGAQARPRTATECVEANYRGAVVHVRAEWIGPNGEPEHEEGSGFVISDTGEIITAVHVAWRDPISERPRIYVRRDDWPSNMAPLEVALADHDREVDVALLRATQNDYALLDVYLESANSDTLYEGQTLIVAGYPEEQGLRFQPAGSAPDAQNGGKLPEAVFRQETEYGESGGPVIDIDGRVVGVLLAGVSTTPDTSYFRKINDVRGILGLDATWAAGRPLPRVACGAPAPPANQLTIGLWVFGALVVVGAISWIAGAFGRGRDRDSTPVTAQVRPLPADFAKAPREVPIVVAPVDGEITVNVQVTVGIAREIDVELEPEAARTEIKELAPEIRLLQRRRRLLQQIPPPLDEPTTEGDD
ncbi:MAG: serine protease [Terricaulis sp.]